MDRRKFVSASLLAPAIAKGLFGVSGLIVDPSAWPKPKRPPDDLQSLEAFPFVTNPVDPGAPEQCDPSLSDYRVLKDGDGRLNNAYRSHAQLRDARKILANAVKLHVGVPVVVQFGLVPIPVAPNPTIAVGLAQLAVTGRAAFSSFEAWHPQDNDLLQLAASELPGFKDRAALQAAATKMLDVAYTTAWAIRANDATWRARREQLGWIAASGEDDLPHRPVNVPSAPYPQYDIQVNTRGDLGNIPIWTRYMVASATTGLGGASPGGMPAPGSLRSLPQLAPSIPPNGDILIYIHGGGSRLEEANVLADQLIAAGKSKGKSYTVISFDLPNSGFSEPFSHAQVAPAKSSYHVDHGRGYVPQDNNRDIFGFPIMSFEERFIIGFIEALDRQVGNVTPRIAAVMGGSLGGNMSLQLSRRKDKYPFLRTIVAWSPTCFKYPDGPTRALVGSSMGGNLIALFQAEEVATTRHEFFDTLYNKPLSRIMGMPPQPQMWYGDSFPCKPAHIDKSRLDRYEYYTPLHRQWTTRLNYEMTQFTFHEGDVYKEDTAEGPTRYLTMTSNMLLAAGAEDDFSQVRNYEETINASKLMVNTPGTTLFLLKTGHSIHDERPKLFAARIVDFLSAPPGPPGPRPGANPRGGPPPSRP